MCRYDFFNPRPDAVFPDPARRWGGGPFAPAPAICQTNGPILDPKTAFDSSGLELSEYVAKFYLNTDDVTGRVKVYFLICRWSLRRAKQPYKIETT